MMERKYLECDSCHCTFWEGIFHVTTKSGLIICEECIFQEMQKQEQEVRQ